MTAIFLCAYGDPVDTRRSRRDNGVMEGPFSIFVIPLFDKAHCFVCGLQWCQELDEILLRRLHATPSDVDNLFDSLEQRNEERNLSPHVSDHLP